MAAGDILNVYSASTNLTVTNLHGIASDTNYLSGWTSGVIDHSSDLVEDDRLTAKITVESSGLTTDRQIQMYILTMLDDSNWPDVYSSGTEGTEGTATIHDANIRNAVFTLVAVTMTDATASQIYTLICPSVAAACGGNMPHKYLVFITQSTGAALETTGNQVTVKSRYRNVAQS